MSDFWKLSAKSQIIGSAQEHAPESGFNVYLLQLAITWRLTRIASAILLCTTVSSNSFSANETERTCLLSTAEEIVDAAIAYYVRVGAGTRITAQRGLCAGTGGQPCITAFPYLTIDEFKERNPGCCRVLDTLTGDEPLTYRPNIMGNAHPRMYLVRLNFKAWTKNKKNNESPVEEYTHRSVLTFNCFGEIMRDDVP